MSGTGSSVGPAPWPRARSRRSTIVAQFGGDRADLAQSAAVLDTAIQATRARRSKLRRSPTKWEAAREHNLAEARKRLAAIADAPEYAGHEPNAGRRQ
jgi:hypothetical protein